jgi:hypothetical protein
MSPPAAFRRRQNGPCESQHAGWPGEAIRSQMMMTPPYPVSLNHRCLHKQPHDRGLASALLSCLLCCAGRRPTSPLSLLLASPFCSSAPSPSQPPTTTRLPGRGALITSSSRLSPFNVDGANPALPIRVVSNQPMLRRLKHAPSSAPCSMLHTPCPLLPEATHRAMEMQDWVPCS